MSSPHPYPTIVVHLPERRYVEEQLEEEHRRVPHLNPDIPRDRQRRRRGRTALPSQEIGRMYSNLGHSLGYEYNMMLLLHKVRSTVPDYAHYPIFPENM